MIAVAIALAAALGAALVQAATPATPTAAVAATGGDEVFLAARDAVRAGDREKLATAVARLGNHPLRPWVEFWQLQTRLRSTEGTRLDDEVLAFFERHPGTYLADRLRLEWLLELGSRREFDRLLRELPDLVWQHDDQQLRCWVALARYGRAVTAERRDALAREARQILAATRESGGDGCLALTEALLADRRVDPWHRIRALVENNQLTTARRIAAGVRGLDGTQLAQALDHPARWLAQYEKRPQAQPRELALVALARLARDNPEQAARFAAALNLHFTPEQRGLAWGRIGHMAALKLDPQALDWYRRGGEQVGVGPDYARADEVLEWQVRAALRGTADGPDWVMLRAAVERMSAELRREPAWIYWHARALQAAGQAEEARAAWRGIAGRFSFYGKLAAEELGETPALPPRAAPPAPELVASFEGNAGFERALRLMDLGLRLEGSREWSWQLRNRSDRELLAIAEFARRRDSLDRMIFTSERTREEFDFMQRFPAPHRDELARHARSAGIDPSWAYGLIRQESRFVADARSSVGARGLMQLMPATARYVARRVGMNDFKPQRITELEVNLRLGTSYLRFVLDDLDGNTLLASAAYNAGPSRARQWRATLPRPVEGAIFAETIPFNETRDYVKKVMSNAAYYAALFDDRTPALKKHLGIVAPRDAGQTDLP